MHVHVYKYTENALSLYSKFHFIVDLPSKFPFTCLRPLRKFGSDTMWLIKDNIKSIASVRLSAVLILTQLQQVLFSCLAWLGQVVHVLLNNFRLSQGENCFLLLLVDDNLHLLQHLVGIPLEKDNT